MRAGASLYPRNFGNYVLLERIGSGGMSEIDLARRVVEDAGFMRFLVIKRIKTDRSEEEAFVRMFKDEARISAELHHTNIAQVYDFGRIDDEYFLVLEYVPGVDVRRIINVARDRGQTVPLRIILRIIVDLLAALHYAHTRVDTYGRPMQVVHRDVNPRNIMVSIRGDVKLIDFGVAKATDRLERTQTDHVKGKFAYMAPEQVTGKEIDQRADVFAAALTLHEMVAGAGPFHGLNQVQIMHRLMSGAVPELPAHPDLPDPTPLRRVQRKALAQRPEDRYADADAYRRDLERFADKLGGIASVTELATYMQAVEPEFEERLRAKMAAFSGPVEALPSTVEIPAVPVGPGETSGSLHEPGTASQVTYTQISAQTAGVAAVGGLAAMAFTGAFVFAALTAGLLVAWQQGVFADAEAVSVPPPDEAVLPIGAPSIEPVPTTPAGTPAAEGPPPADPPPAGTASSPPAAASSKASTAASPVTASSSGTSTAADPPPVEAVVDPVVDPPPVVEVVVTPPPVDPPPPTPEVPKGTLQVSSAEKGRPIFINGQPTPYVTPAKILWAPGDLEVRVEGYAPKTVSLRSRQFATVTFQ